MPDLDETRCSATSQETQAPSVARFTPGPWVWDGERPFNAYSDDATGSIVATAGGSEFAPRPYDEKVANARLIAAAPELYAALSAVIRFGELANVSAERWGSYTGGKKPASKDVWQFPRHLLTDLETALAKARGEQP